VISVRKLLLSAVIIGIAGMIAGAATWSAFSGATSNSGNTFQAGTVSLTDNDNGGTLVTLSNATPGSTTTGCITVTYNGSLPADVNLYATVSGTLAQYLTLKVTRGSNSGAFPSCTFNADNRDYISQGLGVIYNGTLSGFPDSVSPMPDPEEPTGNPESWTNGEIHSYKLEVTLQDNAAAQGQSATASFTWEARNQ